MEIKEITNVLETILPGSDLFESDIYFEPLSMSGLEEMHEYSIDERLYEFFEFKPFETINETKNMTCPALPPVINMLKVIVIAKKVYVVLIKRDINLSKSN